MEIMAAHRMPYAATASPAFPDDLTYKIKKAKAMRGTRFLHVLSPCNTGWKIKEDMAVQVAMLSVETNVFPLYEIEDGVNYTLNYEPKGLPIDEYLNVQGRYKHLKPEQIKIMQEEADRNMNELKARIARSPNSTNVS
jgi:pyruvate/2-oxoacid:ferredoxin oxidoreductase beta subunit